MDSQFGVYLVILLTYLNPTIKQELGFTAKSSSYTAYIATLTKELLARASLLHVMSPLHCLRKGLINYSYLRFRKGFHVN